MDPGTLQTSEQIGVGLHLAALAALAGDAQLASRLRHRAERTRKREAYEAARERDRAARHREQAARAARIQNGWLVAQCRFLLADTSRNRLQLSEALAGFIEELQFRQHRHQPSLVTRIGRLHQWFTTQIQHHHALCR